MATLIDIEPAAKAYADARAKVAEIVTQLNDGIDALKRNHMPALKRAIARAAEKHEQLKTLIDANPALFVKPRTVIYHGVKVGFKKGAGGISFDDADQVVRLIKKHFPEQADVLVITTEKPSKEALGQLTVAELKKIGCNSVEAGDQVVIKPTDSDTDKLVNALIKGATEAEGDAA